jgi:flagellar assembly factor FliW
MDVLTSRFGKIEVEENDVIHFPDGIIGFSAEKRFVLVPHGDSSLIGWLQSLTTPEFALPVVSAHALVSEYPDVPLGDVASRSGLGGADDLAVLAVLSAPASQPPTVNLLAPLLVNAATRRGAQIFLEGSRFTTQELFALPQAEGEPGAARAAASP